MSVSIAAIDASGAETLAGDPADTAVVRITRTDDTTNPLTVFFTRTGTAKINTDYTVTGAATAGAISAVIPAGETFVDVTLTPVNNALSEPSETVIFKLLAKPTYTLDADPGNITATLTIADNEPVVTVAATDNSATETAGDSGTYRISRTGDTAAPLTVKFTVTGSAKRPTDFVLRTGGEAGTIVKTTSVVIPAGQSFVDLTLTTVDDVLTDNNETATLTIAKSTVYNLAADPADRAASIAIVDNEPVISVVKTKDTSEVNGTTTARGVFTISRTGLTTAPLTVNFTVTGTATAGDDYTALPASVVIPKGKSSVTINVEGLSDSDIEGNETVVLTLDASAEYTVSAAKADAALSISDSPIAAAGLFGNVTFSEETYNDLTTNVPFAGKVGQITSTGTFTSTNGRTGSYTYTTNYGPGQTTSAFLRLLFAGQPTLDAQQLILTYTAARPDSLNGRTVQWPASKTGSSGDFTGEDAVLYGLSFISVGGYFKVI